MSVVLQAQDNGGNESSLEPSAEAAIQSSHYLFRRNASVGERTQDAHDEKHIHRSLQPLTAHVAERHAGRSVSLRDDLKEISADLQRRPVGAGDCESVE